MVHRMVSARGKAGGCARVTAGPKRPHLGVCPGPTLPLQGRQGSRGCIPGSPGESGLVSRHQGSQVSMRVARGSASWLSSHGRGLGPRDAWEAGPWPQASFSSFLLPQNEVGFTANSQANGLETSGREAGSLAPFRSCYIHLLFISQPTATNVTSGGAKVPNPRTDRKTHV